MCEVIVGTPAQGRHPSIVHVHVHVRVITGRLAANPEAQFPVSVHSPTLERMIDQRIDETARTLETEEATTTTTGTVESMGSGVITTTDITALHQHGTHGTTASGCEESRKNHITSVDQRHIVPRQLLQEFPSHRLLFLDSLHTPRHPHRHPKHHPHPLCLLHLSPQYLCLQQKHHLLHLHLILG